MADKPPMCPGTLLLGNAASLLEDTAGTLTRGFERIGPMFRIRAAWRHYTVIAGPDAAEFMAQGLDKTHLSRERLFGPVAREFGADLVLKEIGPRHARLRPPLAVSYSRQVASPFVPSMVEAMRERMRSWPASATVPVVTAVRSLAFDQYRVLLGGPLITFSDSQLVTDVLMNVAARVLPPFVCRLPWYRRAHARNLEALTALVRARRADGAGDRPPTLIDALATATDPSGSRLSEDEVVSYAAYGLGASIGYVGRLTAFMLYEILRDEALRTALVAEARQAFTDGLPDASAVRRMRLLRSVYDETLRFHSVAIGMAFDVASGFEFRGHRVDAGDYLVLTPVPSSFSPAAFTDPHRFDAARCREPRNEHRRSGACQPFGLGDRTCSAMGLVELMCMTLVATVLHARTVTLDPPGYTLRRTVRPLPSPDRRFRMRVGDPPAPGPAATTSPGLGEDEALAVFPGYDDPAVRAALAHATAVSYDAGAVILREGDPAEAFYLVDRGRVTISRQRGGVPELVAELGEGEWFGEAGLLQNAPRNATVRAAGDGVTVRVLARRDFLAMVAASDLVAAEIGQLLRKRTAIERLRDAASLLTATGAAGLPGFTSRVHGAGETILRQGDPADAFFIVVRGVVVVTRQEPSGITVAVTRLEPGEYFGEMGLLHAAPRNATVTAGDHEVETLVTDRDGFDRLLTGGGGPRGELARAMLARVERLQH